MIKRLYDRTYAFRMILGDKLPTWLLKALGYCRSCCDFFKYPKRRRLNTAYVDDSLNYIVSCKSCYDKAYAHYEDMWSEYYSGRL